MPEAVDHPPHLALDQLHPLPTEHTGRLGPEEGIDVPRPAVRFGQRHDAHGSYPALSISALTSASTRQPVTPAGQPA